MTVKKHKLFRPTLFALIGGIVGLTFSVISREFGSSCQIMCNLWVATSLGMVMGLVMALPQEAK